MTRDNTVDILVGELDSSAESGDLRSMKLDFSERS